MASDCLQLQYATKHTWFDDITCWTRLDMFKQDFYMINNVSGFADRKLWIQFLWKGIRVTMLFDLLTCIMQCCYIQCMIIQCLIFLLQFQFDFITFHFFFLQSCFRAFDICPSSMQDFHCAMRYAILRSTIIHTPSCHYSYFVMPYCFVYANCNYTSRWRFTRTNKLWVGPYTPGLPPTAR